METQAPQFSGIVPPLITPLLDYDTLNRDGLERLVEHVIQGGVSGIFVLGTTGEAPSLSYRLRREMIEATCTAVAGRVPVLVGVTDTSFVETIELSKSAGEAGAAAVVLSTPYYFPAGQTELVRYIEHVAERCRLPIMLYNMPSMTKVVIETETLAKLTQLENIVGVKDSGGDQAYFQRLLELKSQRPDWSVLIGPEHLTAWAVSLGGDGGVNGGANIYPEWFVSLYDAVKSGDRVTQAAMQARIEKLQKIYDVGKYASRYIKATKCGVSLRGICADFMAEPFNHFLEPERDRVQAILDSIA